MIWAIVGVVAIAFVATVLTLWRRATAKIVQLETERLGESFTREVLKEADAKKQHVAAELEQRRAIVDEMTPEELEKEINE